MAVGEIVLLDNCMKLLYAIGNFRYMMNGSLDIWTFGYLDVWMLGRLDL